ncbi:MAG: DNA-binding protein WhiA [Syntrophomonadaceae bacterium]|nr:DNA-binding protein WhiA [Syntrophomonadaceae bacterium]
MSFSNQVRNELARIIPEKECCCRAELSALLVGRGELISGAGAQDFMSQEDALAQVPNGYRELRFSADNPIIVRKVYRLLRRLYNWQPSVGQQTERRFNRSRTFSLECLLNEEQLEQLGQVVSYGNQYEIRRQVNNKLVSRQCCRRAYLRGFFICHGFVSRPEGNYHLELIVEDGRMATDLQKLLSAMGVSMRRSERKGQLILYIKDGEQIVDFLRVVEANNALLEFENVRILKSMRNRVNRQVNCENANLDKTVNAAVRQVDLIQLLLQKKGIKWLPQQLREVAVLRLDNPDATLKELGLLMEPPLSKGGMAYRMRRLEALAEQELVAGEDVE